MNMAIGQASVVSKNRHLPSRSRSILLRLTLAEAMHLARRPRTRPKASNLRCTSLYLSLITWRGACALPSEFSPILKRHVQSCLELERVATSVCVGSMIIIQTPRILSMLDCCRSSSPSRPELVIIVAPTYCYTHGDAVVRFPLPPLPSLRPPSSSLTLRQPLAPSTDKTSDAVLAAACERRDIYIRILRRFDSVLALEPCLGSGRSHGCLARHTCVCGKRVARVQG
ncbi:hypothetical protein B0H19DRAFT_547178 [Mycena capillaripes]|nr:hypothetical protein B0H19DRAFT_547178 [Mycena capillaripes]